VGPNPSGRAIILNMDRTLGRSGSWICLRLPLPDHLKLLPPPPYPGHGAADDEARQPAEQWDAFGA